MTIDKTHSLFSGNGTDPSFLGVRDNPSLIDIRDECERLWEIYKSACLHDQNFVDQFSRDFIARFWELYLGAQILLPRFPELKSSSSDDGPDFTVKGTTTVYIEATVANRGEGADAVPVISERSCEEEPLAVSSDLIVLRLTNALREKAKYRDLQSAYVVAVNLPFPEVSPDHVPPITAQATLGLGESMIGDVDTGALFFNSRPSVTKLSLEEVSTIGFLSDEYAHISALVVGNVNPFSSNYKSSSLELLHNPKCNHKLPLGWLTAGREYYCEGGTLKLLIDHEK